MALPTSTLLISTYNRSDALGRCLESVLSQSSMPEQIVVADDGSGEDTRKLIEDFNQRCSGRCQHVWQENKGFRVARIRNKALRAAKAEYIIQIDGDMVLHPDFVADHLSFAEHGFYVRANKYMLTEAETALIIANGLPALKAISFPISRSSKARRIPLLRYLSHLLKVDIKGVFGSNMAYWLQDAIDINGYDNNFSGWGSEDDDFADRLRMKNVHCKSIRFGAIAYHLHHPPADRSSVERNNALRGSHRTSNLVRAMDGYLEVLPDNE